MMILLLRYLDSDVCNVLSVLPLVPEQIKSLQPSSLLMWSRVGGSVSRTVSLSVMCSLQSSGSLCGLENITELLLYLRNKYQVNLE